MCSGYSVDQTSNPQVLVVVLLVIVDAAVGWFSDFSELILLSLYSCVYSRVINETSAWLAWCSADDWTENPLNALSLSVSPPSLRGSVSWGRLSCSSRQFIPLPQPSFPFLQLESPFTLSRIYPNICFEFHLSLFSLKKHVHTVEIICFNRHRGHYE